VSGLRQRLRRLERGRALRPCAACGGDPKVQWKVLIGEDEPDPEAGEGRCPGCGQGGTYVIRFVDVDMSTKPPLIPVWRAR